MSVPKRKPGKGRVAYSSDMLALRARQLLHVTLTEYGGGQRYRAQVLQTLRPLYDKTGVSPMNRMKQAVFDEWIVLGTARESEFFNSGAAGEYVRSLTSFVADRLRCTEDGKAPYWLLHTIHSDVAGFPQEYGTQYDSRPAADASAKISLEIQVNSDRFAVLTGINVDHVNWLGAYGTSYREALGGYGRRFDQWDDLHRLASEAVEGGIEQLKREHYQHTDDFERKNVVNLERVSDAADDLVRWHWGREEPPTQQRKSKCKELREILDLDPIPYR